MRKIMFIKICTCNVKKIVLIKMICIQVYDLQVDLFSINDFQKDLFDP